MTRAPATAAPAEIPTMAMLGLTLFEEGGGAAALLRGVIVPVDVRVSVFVVLGVCVGDAVPVPVPLTVPVPVSVPLTVPDTDTDTEAPGMCVRVSVAVLDVPGTPVRVPVAETDAPMERVCVTEGDASGGRVRDPVAELDCPPVRVPEPTADRVALTTAEDTGETGRVRVPVPLSVRLDVGGAAWVRLPVLVGLSATTRVGEAAGSCA